MLECLSLLTQASDEKEACLVGKPTPAWASGILRIFAPGWGKAGHWGPETIGFRIVQEGSVSVATVRVAHGR